MEDSFFSPDLMLIKTESSLGFDLYVNSSLIESREKFVKIFQ